MPSVQYGSSAYKRTNGNFPELKLINMFVEKAATSENQVALLSREGLAVSSTAGAGPINGIFAQEGTFAGDVFSLSGSELYRGTADIGAITGTGFTSFAGGFGELLVTRGSTLHSYNGTNLAGSGFVGNATNNVTSCCFIGSVFVAIEANSARFFWSAPLDGRTWDVLHFETAEREPDNLLDGAPLLNNLWLFGQQTVEVWSDTGDATARFSRVETIGYDKGIMATGCVCPADNALFFISSDRVVYRIGEAPVRISDHGIEGRILASLTAKTFPFRYQGHEFVCIRLDTETLAYDCATQAWCEFQTSQGNWLAQCAAISGGAPLFGSSADGSIYEFSGWTDNGAELERRLSFAQQIDKPTPIGSVQLWANAGHVSDLTLDPIVELRLSDDAGNTWGDWDQDVLGSTGDYRHVPTWRALGMFDFPGVLGEIRVTDNCPFRLSAIKVNESAAGRSR